MKHLILAFCACFFCLELIFPVGAVNAPNIDEIEMMLKKIENNMRVASQVVSVAQTKSAAFIVQKTEEKKELKKAVVSAEAKAEAAVEQMHKVEEKVEFYQVKMIGNGIDTSFQEVAFGGPAYEAFLNYVEEGGTEDFEYFRIYLWQQK